MRLALIVSLLFVTISAQLMRDEGPTEEYQQKSAFYGMQYTKFGQLRTFDAAWNQILIIKLPTFADYAPLLQELRTYCYMMTDTNFGPVDYLTGKQLGVPSEAASAHSDLIKSCRGYERTMRNTLKELLFSAFNESLPNPTAPNHEIAHTITSKTDRDFKLDVRTFDSADFEIHANDRVTFNPINSEGPVTTTGEPMSTTATFVTSQPITDNAKTLSETVTETSATNTTPQTESALDTSLPQNSIVASSYDDILRQTNRLDNIDHNGVHSRDKRFLFTALGLACVALLSASFGAWGVSLQNSQRIRKLEYQVHKLINIQRDQDAGSSLVTESLLGLTEVNENRFSNGSAQLDRVLRLQRINSAHINENYSLLKNLSKADAISNTIMLHMVEQVDLIQKTTSILNSARRKIRDFETGLISLLNNQMSTYFMPYAKLRKLLYQIRDKLPTEYQLAISDNDIHLYYTFRLTSFARTANKLVLRMIVPLSVNRGVVTPETMYQPIYNTVPVPRKFDLRGEQNFMKIYSTDKEPWIFTEGSFSSQVSMQQLSCHEIGPFRDCIRFRPLVSLPVDRCTKLIWQGQFDADVLFAKGNPPCKAYHVDKSTYHPIRLSDSLYIIHGSSFLRYRVQCPGKKLDILEVGPDTMMSKVELDDGCILIVNNDKIYPGPIISRQFNVSYDFLEGKASFELPTEGNRIRLPSIVPFPLSSFNSSKVEFKQVNNQSPVEIIINRLRRELNQTNDRIEKYDSTFAAAHTPTVFSGMLKIVEEFVFDILVILLAILTLRSGRWIYFTAPTVIFLSDQASASFVDSIISSFNSDSLSIDYYSNVLSIIKLLFLSILVLVFFTRNLINRVYVSNHRGALRSCQTKYLIAIDLMLTCHCFCYSSQQHVTLLYPLRVKKENLIEKEVTAFEVINKNQGFKIKNNQFSLGEKVKCKGRNASGDITLPVDVPISFDLNSLVWNTGKKCKINYVSYGDCFLSIMRNPKDIAESRM